MRMLSPYKRGVLGGVITFAIFLLVLVVGAVTAQRAKNPTDAVDEQGEIELAEEPAAELNGVAASTSAVLQIFSTNSSYNGAGPAGYGRTGMDAACRAQDPGSHFCTLQEVENAWKTGGINFNLTEQSWVDHAIVGTIDPGFAGDFQAVSDWYGGSAVGDHPYNCNAWTVNGNVARGLIINTGSISPAVDACDDIHPISCCRRVVTYWSYLPVLRR